MWRWHWASIRPLGGVVSGVLGALLEERLQRREGRNHGAVINTVLAEFLGFNVLPIQRLNLRLDLEPVLSGHLLAVGGDIAAALRI